MEAKGKVEWVKNPMNRVRSGWLRAEWDSAGLDMTRMGFGQMGIGCWEVCVANGGFDVWEGANMEN